MAKIFCLTILLSLLIHAPAWAGMAVSDATQHMYSAKNLEETIRQLETAMEQLEMVKQSTDTLKKTYEEATTQYNRARGFYDEIMRVKQLYDSTQRSIMGRYHKVKKLYELASEPGKALEGFKDLLDDGFKDPRNLDPEKWKKVMDKQFDLRQLSLRDLLMSSEEQIEEMQKRFERTQELSKQVDQTVSPKDAQDLTNRLLTEILFILQQQLAMNIQYQQTMATLKYQGVTQESIKERQDHLNSLEQRLKESRWETEELAKYGLSRESNVMDVMESDNKPSVDEIINWKP